MSKRLLLLTVTLLLVFGIAQVASAGMGWGMGEPGMAAGTGWVGPVEKLNLNDEQITKMREIHENTYKQTRDLRIKLMDKKHELMQLKLQKNPDQAAIEAKIKEINLLQEELRGIVQQNREQCRSLLTPEQQEQLKQFRGKKGGGPRGGPNQ